LVRQGRTDFDPAQLLISTTGGRIPTADTWFVPQKAVPFVEARDEATRVVPPASANRSRAVCRRRLGFTRLIAIFEELASSCKVIPLPTGKAVLFTLEAPAIPFLK
jgi:hypothetical protein